MKTKLNLFQARVVCAVALGMGSSFCLAAAAEDSADTAPPRTSAAIPWSQIGAKGGADYKGDGLAVIPTAEGARLRCVFQRLEGEATREGLWLTSTVIPPSGTVNERFRVTAAVVERAEAFGVRRQSAAATPLFCRRAVGGISVRFRKRRGASLPVAVQSAPAHRQRIH